MRQTAYQLYVNSRPLLRGFENARRGLEALPDEYIGPYVAGRFDGDGSWGSTPRIVYRTEAEATIDQILLDRLSIRTSVLHYRKANEYCIYIHKRGWRSFVDAVKASSWKINRRLTL